ncbi:uncharacterized protein MYCGRDRAFT_95105 [Zymoseptoria tritici IPO323]|uniref:Ubiquitin interaction motif protein n=1 Tax=Zymoseptoria tritici (strain CBS 115943 / IPO323) TaxID=336722 RepID=F9XHH0_ZYMTI|nr:uncharacterized protein MYCGRDRAFT_95105 [Zymoseptoria tritici IPO323]EGP84979.1 hypothetical protein MYCGRDRAFT_95105 [Zymoseptoria tritici IPO323]
MPKQPADYSRKRQRRRLNFNISPIDLDRDYGLFGMGFVPNQFESKPLVPKRPDSQKAAMSAEPTADQVEQVINFTGTDRTTAIRFLKVKHNDPTAAVNAIYDEENIDALEKANGWDESVFHADRNGNPDSNLHPLGTSAAPTRGNSPARSLHPNNRDEEDGQLAAALAASQGDLQAQETGIMNANGGSVHFGPSEQGKDYVSGQWAMVKSTASELVPDLEIEDRLQAKEAAEPRLLKHLQDGDYTPNLLTICHTIPRAREAFLLRSHVRDHYGEDSHWWSGTPIQMPTVVHLDGTPADPDSDKQDEFIAEVQRLMAFLDASDRVYASVGALSGTALIKDKESTSGTLLESFLQSWSDAVESKQGGAYDFARLFTSKVGTSAESGMITPNMMVVDLNVETGEGQKKDLSELLDDLLWDAETKNPNDYDMADRYIERPADVFVMRLQQKTPRVQLGVEIPAVLHLDKYLEENVEYSRAARQQMRQHRQRVSKIESIEGRLQKWQHPQKSTRLEAGEMLKHTINHFSGQNRKDAEGNESTELEAPSEAYAAITKQLEEVVASISDKLEKLSAEKERTRNLIAEISKAPPTDLQQAGLKHRYTLRGVATKSNITYVLLPKRNDSPPSPSQNGIPPPSDSETPPGMQWWRLDYDSTVMTPRITRTPADDWDVLRAVELEHNSALLVYASDAATDYSNYNPHLPQPLMEFVDRDNERFQADLASSRRAPPIDEIQEIQSWDHIDEVRQSTERRLSVDSTMADRDPSPPGYDDAFDDEGYGDGRYGGRADNEVHEIRLDPPPEGDVEMIEREHAPLTLTRSSGGGAKVASSDMDMGGMESQDGGAGGASHVEDAGGDMKH